MNNIYLLKGGFVAKEVEGKVIVFEIDNRSTLRLCQVCCDVSSAEYWASNVNRIRGK